MLSLSVTRNGTDKSSTSAGVMKEWVSRFLCLEGARFVVRQMAERGDGYLFPMQPYPITFWKGGLGS